MTLSDMEQGALVFRAPEQPQKSAIDLGRLAFKGFLANSPVADFKSIHFDPGYLNNCYDSWVGSQEAT